MSLAGLDGEEQLQTIVANYNLRELRAATDGNSLSADNYAAHLLALLCVGDLVNARFLWQRVPSQLQRLGGMGCAAKKKSVLFSPHFSNSNAQLKTVHAVLDAQWRGVSVAEALTGQVRNK
jgi:hypothetical protein